MGTLYNGLPHGLTVISHTDFENKHLPSVEVGVFNHGHVYYSAFTCVNGNGLGFSFGNMQNERSKDGSYLTFLNPNIHRIN